MLKAKAMLMLCFMISSGLLAFVTTAVSVNVSLNPIRIAKLPIPRTYLSPLSLWFIFQHHHHTFCI